MVQDRGASGGSEKRNGCVQSGSLDDEELDLGGDDDDSEAVGEGDGDIADGKVPGKCELSGSETEAMSISDVDDECQIVNGLQRNTSKEKNVLHGADTESMSADEPVPHGRKRKALQEKPRTGNKAKSVDAKSGVQKQQPQHKQSGPSSEEQPSGRKRAATNQQKTSKDSVSRGSVDENNPLAVYDFEASPPRPKTRKVKKQIEQQTKREVHLKRLAAANKTWGATAVSEMRSSSNINKKHVSFSDDSLMTESSSAEDTDSTGKYRGGTSSIE